MASRTWSVPPACQSEAGRRLHACDQSAMRGLAARARVPTRGREHVQRGQGAVKRADVGAAAARVERHGRGARGAQRVRRRQRTCARADPSAVQMHAVLRPPASRAGEQCCHLLCMSLILPSPLSCRLGAACACTRSPLQLRTKDGRPCAGAAVGLSTARRTQASGQPDGAASLNAPSQRWASTSAWRTCATGARAWRAAQADAAAVRGHPGQAVPGVDRGRRTRRAAQVQPPRLGPVAQAQKAQPAAAARAGVGVPGDRHMLRRCAGVKGRVEDERPRLGRLAAAQLPYAHICRVLPGRHGDALPIGSSICRSDMTLSKAVERGRAQTPRAFREERGRDAHSVGRSRDAHTLGSSEGPTGHSAAGACSA